MLDFVHSIANMQKMMSKVLCDVWQGKQVCKPLYTAWDDSKRGFSCLRLLDLARAGQDEEATANIGLQF